MRTWRKTLGIVAGGLVGLGGWASSADAQYPPQGDMPPGMGMPSPSMGMPGGGYAMPPMMGIPPSMGGPTALPTNSSGFSPGAFGPPPMGAPADFPNPSQPTGEPASPLSLKEDGLPNAFSSLVDPRRREAETYVLTFNGSYINYHITAGSTQAILATTSTTTTAGSGSLGLSNTGILVPNGNILDYGNMPGVRLQMGIAVGWMFPLEISGFSINRNLNIFQGGSSDASGYFIGRPVTLIDQGNAQAVLPVNVPGVLNGTLAITSQLSFWDAEANFLFNFADTDTFKLDLIVGYRHVDLYESMLIQSSSGGNIGTSANTTITDSFRTRNQFDGGQFGIRGVFNLFEKLNLFADVKLGLGNTHEDLYINGNTTSTQGIVGTGAQSVAGGLSALPSNIGQVGQNRFTLVPEANLTLSYQLHPHCRIFAGYNFLYLNNVIRPGDYITNAVDSRQVPVSGTFANGSVAPLGPSQASLLSRSLTTYGYNFGIEIGF